MIPACLQRYADACIHRSHTLKTQAHTNTNMPARMHTKLHAHAHTPPFPKHGHTHAPTCTTDTCITSDQLVEKREKKQQISVQKRKGAF